MKPGILCKSSARHKIYMKYQALRSLKNTKKNKMSSATVVISALRIKVFGALWILKTYLENTSKQGVY